MSGFSAEWLTLREPLDAASRAPEIARRIVEALAPARASAQALAVIDLGAGTGANLRYAAPLLQGEQDWLLVEHDPLLQAAGRQQLQPWLSARSLPVSWRALTLDLAGGLPSLPLPRGALLTASALLDLVSEHWLQRLLARAAASHATVWFALTYDGRMRCDPAEPEDAQVRELVNRHQRTDKGFGPALGPAAGPCAAGMLTDLGYRVQLAASDWQIGPAQDALQRMLIEGWYNAAYELAPHGADAWGRWRTRRLAHLDAGTSRLQVGHVDLAAGWQG